MTNDLLISEISYTFVLLKQNDMEEYYWINKGDKFKRDFNEFVQVIDEIVLEDGELNVHHHDINREDGCGYCSPISSFKIEDKL